MNRNVNSIAGRLSLGWITDRWAYRKVMIVALLLMAVGLVCFLLIPAGTYFVVLFLFTFPIGFGGAMVLRPPFVLEYFGQARFGTIFGLAMSACLLGGMAGPPLAGWIFDTTGTYQLFWVISIGALVLAVLAILTCPRSAASSPIKPPGSHDHQTLGGI